MNKRRKGFPSETKVKRGVRIVHGYKERTEKLGRNERSDSWIKSCNCHAGRMIVELRVKQDTEKAEANRKKKS